MLFRVAAAAERGRKGVKNEKRKWRVTFPLFFRPRVATSTCPFSSSKPRPSAPAAIRRQKAKKGPLQKARLFPKGRVQDTLSKKGWGRQHSILSPRLLFSLPQKTDLERLSPPVRRALPLAFFLFFPPPPLRRSMSCPVKESSGDCSPAEEQKEKLLRSRCPLRSKGNVDTPKRTKKATSSFPLSFFLPSFPSPLRHKKEQKNTDMDAPSRNRTYAPFGIR